MSRVEIAGLCKRFGPVTALSPTDLSVEAGEFVVVVGPSGCGKSTLLRLVAGLEEPSADTIAIGGRDVTHAAPADRGLAMVFQSYANLCVDQPTTDNVFCASQTRQAGTGYISSFVVQPENVAAFRTAGLDLRRADAQLRAALAGRGAPLRPRDHRRRSHLRRPALLPLQGAVGARHPGAGPAPTTASPFTPGSTIWGTRSPTSASRPTSRSPRWAGIITRACG